MITNHNDMRDLLAFHNDMSSPTLTALQDLILSQPGLGIDPGDALDAARVLLAVHARELGELVQQRIEQDRADDMSNGLNRYAHHRRGGMTSARQTLDRYADALDTTAASEEGNHA